MSYDNEHDESGKGLREFAESQKKLAEKLQKELDTLKAEQAKANLTNLYKAKNVPPSIQRWMDKDGVEGTEAAVDKWLSENGADFGWKPGGAQEESEGATPEEAPAQASAPQAQSVLTPEQQEALARVQEIFGSTSGQSTMPADTAKAAVDKVASNTNVGHSTFTTPYEDVVKQLAAEGFDIAGDIKY